jgi:hypothetical protein
LITHYCLIKCRKTLVASWLFASLTWNPPASESCCNLWLSLMQEHAGCGQPCCFLVWLGKSTWCPRDGRCITSLLIWSQSEWAYCGWRVVAPSYTHVSGDLLCLLVNYNVTFVVQSNRFGVHFPVQKIRPDSSLSDYKLVHELELT